MNKVKTLYLNYSLHKWLYLIFAKITIHMTKLILICISRPMEIFHIIFDNEEILSDSLRAKSFLIPFIVLCFRNADRTLKSICFMHLREIHPLHDDSLQRFRKAWANWIYPLSSRTSTVWNRESVFCIGIEIKSINLLWLLLGLFNINVFRCAAARYCGLGFPSWDDNVPTASVAAKGRSFSYSCFLRTPQEEHSLSTLTQNKQS